MFRIQDNVPEVYVEESRDFQLFTRIFDFAFQSCKLRADSLQYCNDPKYCDESVLELLQTKTGLFDKLNVNIDDLRKILTALPDIIPYKGSLKGIQAVVNLYQRLCSVKSSNILHMDRSTYVIELNTDAPLRNLYVLHKLMHLVVPSGFKFEYYQSVINSTTTKIVSDEYLDYRCVPKKVDDDVLYRTIIGVTTELNYNFDIMNIPEIATTGEKEIIENDIQL